MVDGAAATTLLESLEKEVHTPEQLALLLDQVTDETLVEIIESIGARQVLDRVFATMAERFLPGKAGARDALIQWIITVGEARYPFHLNLKGEECTAASGESLQSPTLGLTIGLPDFLRLVANRLDGTAAFMGGRIAITGDIMLAMAMQSWFQR